MILTTVRAFKLLELLCKTFGEIKLHLSKIIRNVIKFNHYI